MARKFSKLGLKKCPFCPSSVRIDRLDKHIQVLHPSSTRSTHNTPAAPAQVSAKGDRRHESTVVYYPRPAAPAQVAVKVVPTPRSAARRGESQQIKVIAKPPKRSLFDPAIWGKPSAPGALLRRLTVIGPYPTVEFFRRIYESLDP